MGEALIIYLITGAIMACIFGYIFDDTMVTFLVRFIIMEAVQIIVFLIIYGKQLW